MSPSSSSSYFRLLSGCIAAGLLLHLIFLNMPGLLDPSESRYASISQRMLQSGNWLVPEIDPGEGFEPFWGKPPLHFWAAAASMKVFGFSEWAARLPSFLAALGTIVFVLLFCRAFFDIGTAVLAAGITATSATFFVLTGSCMVDITLTFTITGSLVSFALCQYEIPHRPRTAKAWGYAMFLFLALGMLTKGPIACLFAGGPIFLWCLIGDNWKSLRILPWLGGLALFLLVLVPWLVLSEQSSPGITYYFFIQENFLRFVSREYGDRYGSGHVRIRGTILLMFCVGFLPWTFVWLAALSKDNGLKRWLVSLRSEQRRWELFCLCWLLIPLIFFSIARSVIFTYVLPSIPAAAILSSLLIQRSSVAQHPFLLKFLRYGNLTFIVLLGSISLGVFFIASWTGILVAFLAGALSLAAGKLWRRLPQSGFEQALFMCSAFPAAVLFGLLMYGPYLDSRFSTKGLMRFVLNQNPGAPLTFFNKFPFSAQFYARTAAVPPAALIKINSNFELLPASGYLLMTEREAKTAAGLLPAAQEFTQVDGWRAYPLGSGSRNGPYKK